MTSSHQLELQYRHLQVHWDIQMRDYHKALEKITELEEKVFTVGTGWKEAAAFVAMTTFDNVDRVSHGIAQFFNVLTAPL
jgi:hypothetical protein